MKKFEVTLSVKPQVTIHDPDKLESVVCDASSSFCQAFYTCGDLSDFVDSFSKQFYYETKESRKLSDDEGYSYCKFVEGYGLFKQADSGVWSLIDEDTIKEMGLIEIEFDNDSELEVDWSAQEV